VERYDERQEVGGRIRGLILVVVLLAAGVFAGSAISQWKPLPEQERPAGLDRQQVVGQIARDLGVKALGRVRVEVLNAGGRAGMAREATSFLRDVGFDVVDFGNATSFGADSTVVIDRSDRPAAAAAVSRALGGGLVRAEPDPNLYVDVTVLLGGQWEPTLPRASTEQPTTPTRWWDLRRLFR
jgi:LytR cell envelope-related transcriptional attenuator